MAWPEALSLEILLQYGTMSGPKSLTIGITVNLEHYENLRLEVNSEVKDQDDARDLARFLSDVLGTYGRGDPATAERIENFKKRVLPVMDERSEAQLTLPKEGARPAGARVTSAETPSPIPPEIAATPPTPPAAPPAAPAQESGAAAGSATCEDCSAPVTQAEQKMSMLFASRVLCRKCLKKV